MPRAICYLAYFFFLGITPTLPASAEVIDFVCDIELDGGGDPTWVFSVDMETGTADLFGSATVDVRDTQINIFWKSNDCKLMQASSSKGVCFNNFLVIDRRTLKGPGVLEGKDTTAVCRIATLENQF